MKKEGRDFWSCESCLKLAEYCRCYDDRSDRIEHKAQWLVDQARRTEDGQAMAVDPAYWDELRHALDMPKRVPRTRRVRIVHDASCKTCHGRGEFYAQGQDYPQRCYDCGTEEPLI